MSPLTPGLKDLFWWPLTSLFLLAAREMALRGFSIFPFVQTRTYVFVPVAAIFNCLTHSLCSGRRFFPFFPPKVVMDGSWSAGFSRFFFPLTFSSFRSLASPSSIFSLRPLERVRCCVSFLFQLRQPVYVPIGCLCHFCIVRFLSRISCFLFQRHESFPTFSSGIRVGRFLTEKTLGGLSFLVCRFFLPLAVDLRTWFAGTFSRCETGCFFSPPSAVGAPFVLRCRRTNSSL